jgi:hypothetical protein
MADKITEPLAIEYDGWDAAEHLVEAQKLGLSLQGIARLYRSTSHFYLTGQRPARLRTADVRILAGPPQAGSISYLIWVMLAHGRLAVYPQLIKEFADICIPEFVKAMLAKRSNQTKALETAIETIREISKDKTLLANRFMDFAETVQRSDQVDKERLHLLIDRMAHQNSSAMIEMVAPVGNTVKTLTHAKKKAGEFVIDEPIADTIRAKGNLEVRDAVQLKVRLTAVDTTNRTVKITAPEFKKPVRAKIIDPALIQPQNAYTHALDNHTLINITAKPVFKDGELYMYYVTDGKPADES